MFGFIKALFGLKRAVKDYEKRARDYCSLPSAELESLTDEDLFEAAFARTEAKVDACDDIGVGVLSLSEAEKAFYVTSYYELEVNNGGLCQFFVNSSREVAPYLADSLTAIGAAEHRDLFESFVTDNAIDLTDLSSFAVDDADDFVDRTERYPFDDFDTAFCELVPIHDLLIPYARKHISDF